MSQRRPNRQLGFSMIELAMVLMMGLIIMGMSIVELQPVLQQIQANAGIDQVKSTIRQARELAISDRRTTVVQFLSAGAANCPASGTIMNCMALTQMNVVAGTPPTQVLATSPFIVVPIESHVQLLSFNGEPDTPDGFIGAAPTPPNGLYTGSNIGAPTSGMAFQSDGTFTDGNGNPINLTVFIGEAGIPTTGRAVTVLGTTGRVFAYHSTGSTWLR